MIKLVDILKEVYNNEKGNSIDFSKDVVFKSKGFGFFPIEMIDANQINISEYIHFKAKPSNWKFKEIGNDIFNQFMELYKGTALEEYNNVVKFTPKKKISGGSDSAFLDIDFMEGKMQWGYETEEDELKGQQSFIGWGPPPLRTEIPLYFYTEYSLEGIKIDNVDIKSETEQLLLTYIPAINFDNYQKTKEFKASIPEGRSSKKSVIKDTFNEFGLAALSYLENK